MRLNVEQRRFKAAILSHHLEHSQFFAPLFSNRSTDGKHDNAIHHTCCNVGISEIQLQRYQTDLFVGKSNFLTIVESKKLQIMISDTGQLLHIDIWKTWE